MHNKVILINRIEKQVKTLASMTSLVDNVYPIIESTLKSNPKNIEKIKSVVAEYLDKNMNKLSSPGPTTRTLFSDSDKQELFLATGVNSELINKVIADSAYIKNHWKNIASPFNVACALTITFAKRNNDEELGSYVLMYLTLSMYPSLHYKYFRFEPDPRIMEYTINNLSNKFKIKQLGTIWNALIDTSITCDKTYSRNISNATDKDITDYIEALKTRLNALIKNIKKEYDKNYKDRNLMGVEQDSDDPDNYSKSESNSYIIERISNSVALKLAINGPDNKIIQICAKLNDIAFNDLRTTINSLCSDKNNNKDIKRVISDILVLFLTSSQNTAAEIRSNKFIIEALQIYKKANTSDKNINEIKSYLDKRLAAYSERYKKSNRVATLNSFRRALYTFFVFTIQANAPG